MAKSPFDQLMSAFEDYAARKPLSLKQKGKALENALMFYNQGNYTDCAKSLVRTSDETLVASVDILTQIYCNVFSYRADSPHDKQLMIERIARGVSIIEPEELSYNEKLEKLLIKTIESCNEERFLKYLHNEKLSNNLAQLEEALPADVFAKMLYVHEHQEVSPLGQDGKEEEIDAE